MALRRFMTLARVGSRCLRGQVRPVSPLCAGMPGDGAHERERADARSIQFRWRRSGFAWLRRARAGTAGLHETRMQKRSLPTSRPSPQLPRVFSTRRPFPSARRGGVGPGFLGQTFALRREVLVFASVCGFHAEQTRGWNSAFRPHSGPAPWNQAPPDARTGRRERAVDWCVSPSRTLCAGLHTRVRERARKRCGVDHDTCRGVTFAGAGPL